MEIIMRLHPQYFDYIKNGTKRVECRVYDDKRRNIKVGDTIKFLKRPECTEELNTTITDLKIYKSFDDAFKNYSEEELADKKLSKEKIKKDLEIYYSPEEQEKYGVVCIEFKII